MGLPDFSQIQQEDWKNYNGNSSFCGAVSLANIFWWFDSRHADCYGTPGDGKDTYSLIQRYHKKTNMDPGPNTDDHNYNNVNDVSTPWNKYRQSGELIERIAFYTNRFKDARWTKIFGPLMGIYSAFKLLTGAHKWLRDANLEDSYTIKPISRPDFSTIDKCVKNDNGVVLGLLVFDKNKSLLGGHFISVAGINSMGYITISDPYFDIANNNSSPVDHNNAGIVSHDIYKANFTTNFPKISQWEIQNYANNSNYLCLVTYALVISDQI